MKTEQEIREVLEKYQTDAYDMSLVVGCQEAERDNANADYTNMPHEDIQIRMAYELRISNMQLTDFREFVKTLEWILSE